MSPVEPFASLQWPSEIVGLDAKQALADRAVDRVIAVLASSTVVIPTVGLGSGSTSFLTLLGLSAARQQLPADLSLVATSYEMEWYGAAAGFSVVGLGTGPVAVAFDGADQVQADGALIKGRGGAVHRERAVLDAAGTQLIVADASKSVSRLGGCALPLVLAPEGIFGCVAALESIGVGPVRLRTGTGKDGPVLTEAGGILADLLVPEVVVITAELDQRLRAVAGVWDTGYFAPNVTRELIMDPGESGVPPP